MTTSRPLTPHILALFASLTLMALAQTQLGASSDTANGTEVALRIAR